MWSLSAPPNYSRWKSPSPFTWVRANTCYLASCSLSCPVVSLFSTQLTLQVCSCLCSKPCMTSGWTQSNGWRQHNGFHSLEHLDPCHLLGLLSLTVLLVLLIQLWLHGALYCFLHWLQQQDRHHCHHHSAAEICRVNFAKFLFICPLPNVTSTNRSLNRGWFTCWP